MSNLIFLSQLITIDIRSHFEVRMKGLATFSISPLVELSLTIVKNLTCSLIYVALAT